MSRQTALSPWVERFAHLAPAGVPVLDVACGAGRNARHFLKLGHRVTATDISLSDVLDLEREDRVTLIKRDLEDGSVWSFGTQTFGTVVVTNYLHRPILPALVAAVAFGGVFIYETFAQGNEAFGKPSNPDFLLKPGELVEAVRGTLQIVAYEHGRIEGEQPAVRQRICAVNKSGPVAIG
jgi:SAM-dependent methyltransferase